MTHPVISIMKQPSLTFEQFEAQVQEDEKITKQTPMVPWAECLPLIDKIEQITGWGHAQILQETGYSSESSFEKWTRAGLATKRFKKGLYGVMFELGIQLDPKPVFSHVELSRLFAVLNDLDIPTDQRRRLITKVAKEMASFDE